jgi:ABC-type uncharacterized transport system substrate-binding protein
VKPVFAYEIVMMAWNMDGLVEKGFRDGIIRALPETRFYTYGAGGDIERFRMQLESSKRFNADLYFTNGLAATKELLKNKDLPSKVFVSIQYPYEDELLSEVDFQGSYGIKTNIPIKQLLLALKKIIDYKKLGVLQLDSGKNFTYSIAEIKSLSLELGFDYVVLCADDLFQFNKMLSEESPDAIYIPAHDEINKHIFDIIHAHNIPTIAEDSEDVSSKGGLLSLIVDRYRAGRLAAIKAVEVLTGKNKKSMEVTPIEHFMFVVNMVTASRLGVQVPMPYLIIADHIVR